MVCTGECVAYGCGLYRRVGVVCKSWCGFFLDCSCALSSLYLSGLVNVVILSPDQSFVVVC